MDKDFLERRNKNEIEHMDKNDSARNHRNH